MPLNSVEDAIKNGLFALRHSKRLIKVCLILNLLSLIAYTVGLGTHWWLKSGSSRIGLWRFCVKYWSSSYLTLGYQYECCQSAEDFIDDKVWLNGVRVLFCTGLVEGLVAFVAIMLKAIVWRFSLTTQPVYVCIVFCFLTAISILAGVGVYWSRYSSESGLKDFGPSGSLVVCMLSGVSFLVSGVALLLFFRKPNSVGPISQTSQRWAVPSHSGTRSTPSSDGVLALQEALIKHNIKVLERMRHSTASYASDAYKCAKYGSATTLSTDLLPESFD